MSAVLGSFESLSKDELQDEIAALAGHLHAATCRFLLLVAELDRRAAWGDWGMRSCAHWLSWRCGIALPAAREQVRVARALGDLPDVTEAFASGELSYSKVRAVTRIATAQNERTLLEWARHGATAQIEQIVRAYRRTGGADEAQAAMSIHDQRRVTWGWEDDGSMLLPRARLAPEEDALLIRAIEAAAEQLYRDGKAGNVSAETSSDPLAEAKEGLLETERRPRRRADALALLAETFLAAGPTPLAGADRHQVVIHVDAQTLAGGEEGRCEIEDGPAIATETARRITCDASIVTLLHQGGEPLDIGRRSRRIPPAMRRALRARDRTCLWPGCEARRFLDAHHRHHWVDGGHTRLENLHLLCKRHHRLVHEGGFTMVMLDDGTVRFTNPDGREIRSEPLRGHLDALTRAHRDTGFVIDADTCRSRWDGRTPDYAIAVEGLHRLRARAG